jgi:hypothetical protein
MSVRADGPPGLKNIRVNIDLGPSIEFADRLAIVGVDAHPGRLGPI